MKAAAMTNSGSAISVVELSLLITICAAPISGWPVAMIENAGAHAEHQEDRHPGGEQAEEQQQEQEGQHDAGGDPA